jgi:hypothetical protein
MKKLKIVVGGFLGLLPAGGVTWDYVQYPLGFSQLGHDVWYVEDTRLYPVYQAAGSQWDDCLPTVRHLQSVMEYFGMGEHWAYRDEASGQSFGLSEAAIRAHCAQADLFVNISCSTFLRDEYRRIPLRILIDSDPMFTQIQYETEQMFTPGVSKIREMVDGHNFLFTFGENIGAEDCRIPTCGLPWRPTRQPICLDQWPALPLPADANPPVTTLMNWAAGKKLTYAGTEWGQKDLEFPKIQNLPRQFPDGRFSIVINQTGQTGRAFPAADIQNAGWEILNPEHVAGNWSDYRAFIRASAAELSIAKETYVKARTGWFSCRSACYLAAGRPVVAQDTGWSKYYPVGEGLFSFDDAQGATEAVQNLRAEPQKHRAAARAIAEEYFASNKVLRAMLDQLT